MTRPLRIELSDALYHVTSRGDRKDQIFRDDGDRLTWLTLLGETCDRFNLAVLAYCQMTNHFHLLLETADGKLSRAMRHLNGSYSQYFNRAHDLVGHVFQGRFKAILCQRELYFKELARYIELNPVRADLVALPSQWPWSSYNTTMGLVEGHSWLRTDDLLAHFGTNKHAARRAYEAFVAAGIGAGSPLHAVSNQLLLGDEEFCARATDIRPDGDLMELKRVERRAISKPLADYFVEYRDPKEAMARAYRSLAYSMPEIARYARVSVKTVSRAINAFEGTY